MLVRVAIVVTQADPILAGSRHDFLELQLELVQCNYMEEELPFAYRPETAAQLQPLLRRLLQRLIDLAMQ